jgi:uncharacterized membrane protein YbhN (UPF0104 family)
VEVLYALYVNRWVRYALTLGLLSLVALKVHVDRVGEAVGSARPAYLALALGLTVPFLYLKALRWHVMLRAGGVQASFGEASLSLIGGMGPALVTPARLGELFRGVFLRDAQKWKIGGLVLVDKAFDVLVLTGLSTAGAWILIGPWAGAFFLLATLVGLTVAFEPRPLSTVLHRLSARLPMRDKLEALWSSLGSLSPGATSTFLALTLAAFLVVLLQFGIVLLSWRTWSPDIVFLTFPLVILTNVMPVTIGGLGIREGAAAWLLSRYGVPTAEAALAAFLMFSINTALPGLIGAFLLPAAIRDSRPRAVRSLDRP